VSSGPAQVTVPSVTGMTQDQAASALASAGLAVSWTTANSDVAAGTVTYQNIAAGTAVDAGTTITCEVSAGPASTTAGTTAATTAAGGTTVPAVTGTSQEAATAALQAAGLSVNWTQSYNTAAAGTVTYQNVPAGTSVAPGTTITCEVSLGPQP
jgi:serine/threonine-protein kinase